MNASPPPEPALHKWLGAAASIRGRGHEASGTPCQDASCAIIEDGKAIIVTSDGAGSASRSEEGANAVVARTVRILSQRDLPHTPDAIRLLVAQGCIEELNQRAMELTVPLRELAATLSFVLITDERCVFGNLGDGLVAGLSGEKPTILTVQAKGEFANETVFLTSSRAVERLQVGVCERGDFDGFVAMTDGAAESLYQRRTGTLAGAVPRMLAWLDENSPEVVETALRESALPMLAERTRDDCTVAMLRQVTASMKRLTDSSPGLQMAFLEMGNAVGVKNRLAVWKHSLTLRTPEAIAAATGLKPRTVVRHLGALRRMQTASYTVS